MCAALVFTAMRANAASPEVVRPAPGSTVFSNTGDVEVRVRPGARLGPHERIELWVDGAPLRPAARRGHFRLSGLTRGEHAVRAVVLDARGRAMDSSPPVSFYVWKASRLFPNRTKGRSP